MLMKDFFHPSCNFQPYRGVALVRPNFDLVGKSAGRYGIQR